MAPTFKDASIIWPRESKMVQRFKVWESELMELEEGEQLGPDEDRLVIVVLESDYIQAVEDDRGIL